MTLSAGRKCRCKYYLGAHPFSVENTVSEAFKQKDHRGNSSGTVGRSALTQGSGSVQACAGTSRQWCGERDFVSTWLLLPTTLCLCSIHYGIVIHTLSFVNRVS